MYIEYLIQMSRKVLFTFVVNSKDVLLKRTGKKQQNKSLLKNLGKKVLITIVKRYKICICDIYSILKMNRSLLNC